MRLSNLSSNLLEFRIWDSEVLIQQNMCILAFVHLNRLEQYVLKDDSSYSMKYEMLFEWTTRHFPLWYYCK